MAAAVKPLRLHILRAAVCVELAMKSIIRSSVRSLGSMEVLP